MIHNLHTITIGRFMDMEESDNDNLILRFYFPLPKKLLKKYRSNLNVEFNKLINKREVVQLYEENVHKVSLLLRIEQVIPTLYKALMLHWSTTGEITKDKELLIGYREICNRELKTFKDIEYLKKKQTDLKEKYEELYPEKKAPEKISMTKIIHRIEQNNPHPIDRNCKLYELAGFIELAKERKMKDGRN